MTINMAAYRELEQRFRERVAEDRACALKRVEREHGVYVPNIDPTGQADYVLVAMEPNFRGIKNIAELERKIEEKKLRGFQQRDVKESLGLFVQAIELYLCRGDETYWFTDLSKGAMPADMAAMNREARYEAWYPLLLEEIELVGKRRRPVIAIGQSVEDFLRKKDFEAKTGRRLFRVLHYSFQSSGAFKKEMANDPEGFQTFVDEEIGKDRPWPENFSKLRQWMAFYYRKRFREISAEVRG